MQVVERTFKLLKLLKHFEEMSLKDMAAALGVRVNTLWNLTACLCALGYVEKSRGGVYRLTDEFYRSFGEESCHRHELLTEKLQRLSAAIKESTIGVRLFRDSLQTAGSVNYEREVTISNLIYDREDAIYRWASGRILLAWQEPMILERILQARGLPGENVWPGIRNREDLELELATIRQQKLSERFAADYQVYSLAVPVLQRSRLLYALGVSFPAFRNTPVHREAIIANLRLTAAAIEAEAAASGSSSGKGDFSSPHGAGTK